ncbi:MAG: hypothetical protein KatS3mg115_2355 [Candidatus Poribacteria bacterium]|nr:MAG: hypothetical protein KatS3mg115_2355 [Candidatus Poribacteria bacterium]
MRGSAFSAGSLSPDRNRGPQAWALDPAIMFRVAETIVAATPERDADWKTDYVRTLAVARWTIEALRQAVRSGEVPLPKQELPWLDRIAAAVENLPEDPAELLRRVRDAYPDLFLLEAYALEALE